jgi:hypothetical protein
MSRRNKNGRDGGRGNVDPTATTVADPRRHALRRKQKGAGEQGRLGLTSLNAAESASVFFCHALMQNQLSWLTGPNFASIASAAAAPALMWATAIRCNPTWLKSR